MQILEAVDCIKLLDYNNVDKKMNIQQIQKYVMCTLLLTGVIKRQKNFPKNTFLKKPIVFDGWGMEL